MSVVNNKNGRRTERFTVLTFASITFGDSYMHVVAREPNNIHSLEVISHRNTLPPKFPDVRYRLNYTEGRRFFLLQYII